MSDYLIRQIKGYLETHPHETAVAIERRAGVPGSTITQIVQGSRPRVNRLAQLLTGVDGETAAEWLRAYLLDDVPPSYQHHTHVRVEPLEASTVREASAPTTVDALTDAWTRLRTACAGGDSLAQWFIDSVNLILGYKVWVDHIETASPGASA